MPSRKLSRPTTPVVQKWDDPTLCKGPLLLRPTHPYFFVVQSTFNLAFGGIACNTGLYCECKCWVIDKYNPLFLPSYFRKRERDGGSQSELKAENDQLRNKRCSQIPPKPHGFLGSTPWWLVPLALITPFSFLCKLHKKLWHVPVKYYFTHTITNLHLLSIIYTSWHKWLNKGNKFYFSIIKYTGKQCIAMYYINYACVNSQTM